VLSCLLQEQRIVFFSSDWARLTLVAESLLLYLQETEDLILVNVDDGSIQASWSEALDLPDIPLSAAECFISRAESLQLQYDLEMCHLGAGTDVNTFRSQRRSWQRKLNSQVLETHIFHSFLRDRLNRKRDSFSRMEQMMRNHANRNRALTETPRRPPMSELSRSGYNRYTSRDHRLSKRLGVSLPNLDQPIIESVMLNSNKLLPVRIITPDSGRRLDALEDFYSLYKTDAEIFPSQMVKSLVDSLPEVEWLQ
ncbi:hypothetical protein GOODEAATRI_028475, partial [Goodea atripinnis]